MAAYNCSCSSLGDNALFCYPWALHVCCTRTFLQTKHSYFFLNSPMYHTCGLCKVWEYIFISGSDCFMRSFCLVRLVNHQNVVHTPVILLVFLCHVHSVMISIYTCVCVCASYVCLRIPEDNLCLSFLRSCPLRF